MIITCYYKKSCENTCFVVIFPFLMENSSFVIIYNPKFHSILFFHSGAFHAQGVDIHPVKIYRFYVKFNKNMVSNVITGIMIQKKIIKKQKKNKGYTLSRY